MPMPKLDLASIAERRGSSYPTPFDVPCRGRLQKALGDAGGLGQFGVNQVRLLPGAWSGQRHWHTHEDELVYMLEGELVLVTDAGETPMRPGDVATFKAGVKDGHHLQNRTDKDALFLVVGTRDPRDGCDYPDIDMIALPDHQGGGFVHRDGTPYPRRGG
jgi:uncharacterized cupin superfamily protein